MKNSDKQILEAFAIGEYIRIFKTDETIYKCFNFNKETTNKLSTDDLSAYYFLKDKKNISIENIYSPSFAAYLSTEGINDQKSEIYYNTDSINIDSSALFMQYNNRCYFLNKNSYNSNIPYSLNTYQSDKKTYEILSSYISDKYGQEYFSNAQSIDNKSIPIYDINENALQKISYLKFSNKNNIVKFIDKYDLSSVSGLLFNGDSLSFDNENYDSIYIDTLINVLTENPNIDAKEVFDDLFSNLSKESFLRMFNQIGQIRSIRDEKYSLTENEYMYSFNLSVANDNKNIPINYFSLKNLKSPELYQNYVLFNINEGKSVKSNAYDFNENIISNIFVAYFNVFAKEIHSYFLDNDVILNVNKNVEKDGFISELAEILHNEYPNLKKSSFETRFKNLTDYVNDYFFNLAYAQYFKINYNVDIRFNEIIITKFDLIDKIFNLYDEFDDNINQYSYNLSTISTIKSLFRKLIKETIEKICGDDIEDFDKFIDEYKKFLKNLQEQQQQEEESIDKYSIMYPFYKKIIEKSHLNEIEHKIFSCEFNDEETIFDKLSGIFKIDIYRSLISPILNEMSLIDSKIFENAGSDDLNEYRERMNSKVENYISSYDNMFVHENEMQISGHLYGYREYNDAFKNTINDMYLTYNYDTSFDENFIKDILPDSEIKRVNDVDNLKDITPNDLLSSSDIYILSRDVLYYVLTSVFNSEYYISGAEQNRLDIKFIKSAFSLKSEIYLSEIISFVGFKWISLEEEKIKIFKILENEYIIALDDSDVGCLFSSINKIKKFEFSERVKGEHYYKEIEKSKSNVFSLNIRNSGLAYNLYTYEEVIQNLLKNSNISIDKDENIYVNGEKRSFAWILDHSNYYKIIEDENTYFNEVKANEDDDDFKSFKYFKENDKNKVNEVRKMIKTKLQIRKTFNSSIRKSIHRYMPVNTTLWKINYLNDDSVN